MTVSFRPLVLALAALALPAAAQTPLTINGSTAGQPTARLPLFGSTPSSCALSGVAEPYDPTPFVVDVDGSYTVAVTEPVSDPAFGGDDTILMVYRDAFDPANACVNFVGIGNETAGSGLTVSLAAADGYVLVVGGFFGTEDDYTVTITGPPGSTPGSGAAASATITGGDGWRMLAAPSTSETIGGLLGPLWTQGFPGADDARGTANVYTYNESVVTDTNGSGTADLNDGYEAAASASAALPAGTGLFVYAFADDPSTPAVESFPTTIAASGTPPAAPFAFPVTFTSSGIAADDGWNLLGNPFETGLDWSAPGWTKTGMSDAIYVYDTASDRYLTYSPAAGGSLGPVVGAYQGFWAQALAGGAALQAPEAARFTGGTFYGRRAGDTPVVVLRVSGEVGGAVRADEARVAFVEGAAEALDAADAYELRGFGPDALRLFAVAEAEGEPLALDISVVPAGGAAVPLGVQAEAGWAPAAATLTLTWPELRLPTDWVATLTDRLTGAEIDLQAQASYTFAAAAEDAQSRADVAGSVLRPGAPRPLRLGDDRARQSGRARFDLRVGAASAVAAEGEAPSEIELGAPRPNPAAHTATLAVRLPRPESVRVEVYDALGRQVAAVDGGAFPAGTSEIRLATGDWVPGAYIVRVTAGATVLTRSLTVVR